MARALFLILALLLLGQPAAAAEDRRLVLVTMDGLAWQEVFRGANPERAADKAFNETPEPIRKAFVDPPERARALTPFLHRTVATKGVLLGDRDNGGCARLENDKWFSYPGYNEILTGRPDPAITTNEHGPNPHVTILEWLNRRPDFAGRVRAVTSWANFRDILNVKRSGLAVNAGWEDMPAATPGQAAIARLQADTARHWPTVRFDGFPHAYALEALKHDKPKVLYVAYGETDDFAHEGRYDQTLWAAQRADRFIAELWAALQADPTYAGKTTLIVTTDHGRGSGPATDAWKHHGRPEHPGSDETWIGMIGPAVTPGARAAGACVTNSQVAATALSALGLDWRGYDRAAAAPIEFVRP